MIIRTALIAATLLLAGAGIAGAAESRHAAKDIDFSFEGPFGTFDRGQLQRGYKVYKEVCSNCHSMKQMVFRNLNQPGGPGFSGAQVQALAATYTIQDLNDQGEPFDRQRIPSDHFPSPFPNDQAARVANGGALPPDLSLITKARAGWTGTFAQLIYGMGGPEYVYSVLTGYEEPPAELAASAPEGKHFNPYFEAGPWIGMAPPLTDGQVTFDDGSPNTVDAMARDVAAFLAWSGEPKMEERKGLGFSVIIYLAILTLLLYLVKRKIWARVEH
jgi:ubiquinol-cytochrome c reductase cytochrome c1 subunit